MKWCGERAFHSRFSLCDMKCSSLVSIFSRLHVTYCERVGEYVRLEWRQTGTNGNVSQTLNFFVCNKLCQISTHCCILISNIVHWVEMWHIESLWDDSRWRIWVIESSMFYKYENDLLKLESLWVRMSHDESYWVTMRRKKVIVWLRDFYMKRLLYLLTKNFRDRATFPFVPVWVVAITTAK